MLMILTMAMIVTFCAANTSYFTEASLSGLSACISAQCVEMLSQLGTWSRSEQQALISISKHY